MLEEALCSFEVAKLLKERGFNIPTLAFYWSEKSNMYQSRKDEVIIPINQKDNWNEVPDVMYSCPTHQMAMAWLREVHKVFIVIDAYHADHWEGYIDGFEISIYSHASTIIVPNEIAHHTDYTEAVEAALKYSLENLI